MTKRPSRWPASRAATAPPCPTTRRTRTATPPLAPITARVRSESQRNPHALRRLLADLDYTETINFSFVEARWERELAGNDDPIQVLNPIASQLAVMRSSLIGSLVHVLRYN